MIDRKELQWLLSDFQHDPLLVSVDLRDVLDDFMRYSLEELERDKEQEREDAYSDGYRDGREDREFNDDF